MDIERHIREKKRLNQALNGKLEEAVKDIREALQNNKIDLMPEISFDVCIHVIEKIHLEKLDITKYLL